MTWQTDMKRRLKHDRAQPQSGLLINTNKWANCYDLAINRLQLMIATDHSTCIECALILKLLRVILLGHWLFCCAEIISVLTFILTVDNTRHTNCITCSWSIVRLHHANLVVIKYCVLLQYYSEVIHNHSAWFEYHIAFSVFCRKHHL